MAQRFIRQTQLALLTSVLAVIAFADHRRRSSAADDRDRGDVPGWVMITVMTAIVVIALLAVFREQVTDAVRNAFTSVRDSGKG